MNHFSKKAFAFIMSFVFLLSSTSLVFAAKTKAELQIDLDALEVEIAKHKELIKQKQSEGKSLTRDVTILDQKIKQSELEIKAREKSINNLSYKIAEKQDNIRVLGHKIDIEKKGLAATLRNDMSSENGSLYFVLNSNSLSQFVENTQKYNDVKQAVNGSLDTINKNKTDLEIVSAELEDAKDEETALNKQTKIQKERITENKVEKKQLLEETKGQEKEYAKMLKDREAQAAKVRAAMFELSGSTAINFGSAYDMAKSMEAITGVRASFLMAIITIESNLGKNVGKGTWKEDMHPTRDQPIFKTICEELGLNPDNQKVSKKQWYGYGGAMGPAQFIPSTWVLYKKQITAVTGNNPPNPWNTKDAFAASSLLLKDNGAAKGGRTNEHRAAVCYLAGCGNSSKAAYQFYGNDVMSVADKYDKQIAILNSK